MPTLRSGTASSHGWCAVPDRGIAICGWVLSVPTGMGGTERSCIRFDLKQLPANCEVATTLAVPLSIIHDYYKTEARKQVLHLTY